MRFYLTAYRQGNRISLTVLHPCSRQPLPAPAGVGGDIALMARALMWCAWVLGIRSRMRVSVMAPVVRFLALTLGASPRGGPKNRHTSCTITPRRENRA